MATFKYVLSKSQHQKKIKSPESMLMLRYTHKKEVTYFFTHKNIDEKYWDVKNQIVKKSCPSSERFNIYLRTFRQGIEDIVNSLLIEGKDPVKNLVKSIYEGNKIQEQSKKQHTFFEYAKEYLKKEGRFKEGTVKSYQTVLNKLKQYEKYSGTVLEWHSFNMDFYYDFLEYYTGIEGFTNNGFGKVIKNIKAILNDATEYGYNSHTGYKNRNFKALREEVNNIYLSEGELKSIIKLNLASHKTLERIRDLFVFGCYTGLRFSDFSQVKPEHITGEILKIKTLKTDEWVSIPLMKQVKDIMYKYRDNPNSLPKSCTNQTMNRYLKEIGEMAGINERILKIRNKGKERTEESLLKYELIVTHTARRSFATNMFKQGVPARVIMKITGHRTEKAFNSYIKISEDENAELMLKYLNKSV